MPSNNWLEIYRGDTLDALLVERDRLRKILTERQGIAAQGYGQKNWTNDLRGLEDQLAACVRVINEMKASTQKPASGVMDYSKLRIS